MKRLVLITLCWVFLGGCQFQGRLQGTRLPDGRVEFSVTYDPPGDRACINAISVMHSDGKGRIEDWSASRQDLKVCRDRIVYGQIIPGFQADAPPKPLAPNQDYDVSVSGSGLNLGATFRLTDTGLELTEL